MVSFGRGFGLGRGLGLGTACEHCERAKQQDLAAACTAAGARGGEHTSAMPSWNRLRGHGCKLERGSSAKLRPGKRLWVREKYVSDPLQQLAFEMALGGCE
jgi:hypothetical protein